MTLPNKITIARIFLIPVFVTLALYYGRGVERGEPLAWQHWLAVGVFVLAAATDGIDGWLARRHGQQSRLGEILDPIADKGLVLSAVVTLSLSRWEYELPLWFPVLVITRDLALIVGFTLLRPRSGPFKVLPTREGKIATFCTMTALSFVLLQFNPFSFSLETGWQVVRIDFLDIPILLAGVFTLISGVQYFLRGLRLFKESSGHHGGSEYSG
jgi:CDP-diacylglycerol--glycerol-3-phosphate 3-phosphatidyltransferase